MSKTTPEEAKALADKYELDLIDNDLNRLAALIDDALALKATSRSSSNWRESPTLDWLRKMLTHNDDNVSLKSAELIVNMIDHYALLDEVRGVDAESPLSDVRAILYQCDRGNISLPWLIDALRGIVERGTLAPSQPAAPVELPVVHIRKDQLQKAQTAPFLCYVGPFARSDTEPLVKLSDVQAAVAAAQKGAA